MDPNYSDLKHQTTSLLEELAPLSASDRALVERALAYAEEAHKDHARDEGVPYIIHPIRATRSLINAGVTDADVLAATLLHDVVEDGTYAKDGSTLATPTHTFEEIEATFGSRVRTLCEAATQHKHRESKREYIERIMAGPVEDRLIKTADKLDNMRSMLLREDRGDRYQRHIQEAHELYLPLARSCENAALTQAMEDAVAAIPDQEASLTH